MNAVATDNYFTTTVVYSCKMPTALAPGPDLNLRLLGYSNERLLASLKKIQCS
jgi:hypothetical protein